MIITIATSCFADNQLDSEIALRNAELRQCQTIGYSLINTCVDNLPPDADTCSALYSAYVACATKLNMPRPLSWNLNLNNFFEKKFDVADNMAVANPFSPCGYEISHVILANKCNNPKKTILILP